MHPNDFLTFIYRPQQVDISVQDEASANMLKDGTIQYTHACILIK